MGLFDHLRAPKGKVWISFDKPTFVEGEGVVGKVNVQAQEYIQSLGVRVEARVFENYEEMVWVTLPNNQRIQERQRRQNVLFSRDVQVTGPNDFGSGPTQTFPFSVGIPPCRATRGGASVENSLKAVVQVKGRPDLTGQTQVAFAPPSSMPQPMQGYMPSRIQSRVQSQPSLRGSWIWSAHAWIRDASTRSDASATGRAGPLQVLPGPHEPELCQLPQLRCSSVNDITAF